eukprot:Plantae.Rhodophyta-Purpureofilum_apyrenoidigerum.ctg4294.p1 GENE.Plantae.Rhodophyta-Purpureofilum_apyrenoidigerum.ctg4294~~Plantae.Rhodophyta-Purpureofilum_apyrenoidigerum.ctg4294.p1  ORF type:complete len:247 (-),score=57.14 Plantae.Rhodophyta-Purpureofilum_apyrenoidigerum.ctg4294:61-801(-)
MAAFVGGAGADFLGRGGQRNVLRRGQIWRAAGVKMAVDQGSHMLQGRKISSVPKPVRNFIFAKRASAADVTEGGLVLTGTAKEKPNFGTVLDVGSGGYFRLTGIKMPIVVQKGDSVIFGKFGGLEVTFDGAKHMFVDQFDVLCKLTNGEYTAESVEPLFDRVFVKIAERAEQTASGIMIAPSSTEIKNIGEVLAVGPGKALENGEFEEMPVKRGDSVVWGEYVGTKLKFGREEYIVLRASDIFAAW